MRRRRLAPRTTCTLRPSSSSIALRGAKRGRLTITARCNGVATLKLRAKVTSTRRVHRKLHTTTVSLAAGSVHAKQNTTVAIKLTLPRTVLSALTHGEQDVRDPDPPGHQRQWHPHDHKKDRPPDCTTPPLTTGDPRNACALRDERLGVSRYGPPVRLVVG